MSKPRPSPGKCVHCLKEQKLLTWDHVIPESWYPEITDGLEKWDIPSCETCNKELGKIEEELLTKLGLCLDPQELASFGIPQKVLRSMNSLYAKDNKDKLHRERKREKVLGESIVLPEPPKVGLLPNFGPINGLTYSVYPTVTIENNDLQRFAEKITKGMAFLYDGSFIDSSYSIELNMIDEKREMELITTIEQNGMLIGNRLGMRLIKLPNGTDNILGIYFIEIWGRFRMYVLVRKKS